MPTALPIRRPAALRQAGGRAAALAGIAALALTACSSAPANPTPVRASTAVISTTASSTTASSTESDATATTTAGSSSGGSGTVDCTYSPDGDAAKDVGTPATEQPTTPPATAELALPTGELTISLDRAGTPCTVGSFVFLAQAGYFDGTTCHRLTNSASLKVLQCGDPTATGRGGPGYSFADETSPDMTYPAGTVAMANAGPDTNGSQFFLVYGDSSLPPDYTVFGQITGGQEALDAVAEAGAVGGGRDGRPSADATISSVTVD